MISPIIKNFETPDEIREFEKGRFELVELPNMTIGKATYDPGWKWSRDVSPLAHTEFCEVEHLGMVLSGSATVVFKDGTIHTVKKGMYSMCPRNPMIAGFWVIRNMCQSTF